MQQRWRVTLIWPSHAPFRPGPNEQGKVRSMHQQIFEHCTNVENEKGRLGFTDEAGKQHVTRLMFDAVEE